MAVKMWQRAPANNEMQDSEAIQVWETVFWSSGPQRTGRYTRIIQRAFQKCRFLGPILGDWFTVPEKRLRNLYFGKAPGDRTTYSELQLLLWFYWLWPHISHHVNHLYLLRGGRITSPLPLFDLFWFQNHRRHHWGPPSPAGRLKCYFLTDFCRFQSWDSGSQGPVTFTWSLLVLLSTRASNLPSFLWGFQSWRWGLKSIKLRPLRRWGDLWGHFPLSSTGRIQRGPGLLLGNSSVRGHRET